MVLFGGDPNATLVPTGLYGYDVEAGRAAEQISRARARSEEAPVYGQAGLIGAALKRRSDMEGAFLSASADAMARRRQKELERLRREAEIRNQRRELTRGAEARNIADLAGGVADLGSQVGAQAMSVSGREMSAITLGDKLPDMLDRGLVEEASPGVYKFTDRGVAHEVFSSPYLGIGR